MKTLIIDGEWNLKRNYMKRADMFAKGEHCGGVFGALESTRSIINKIMPDRVVVMWDGVNSGIKRKELYSPYKETRNKSWEENSYFMTDAELERETRNKYSLLQQKIKLKNYFEELCIRQSEVDYIEADDLIAQYILKKQPDEQIVIFSRDKDYLQLINNEVSLCTPDSDTLITPINFKEKYGFPLENALFSKCIEGDTSDNIEGVKGVTIKTMEKYFPRFMDEKYSLDRLISEAEELNKKKKMKTLEKIIDSRRVLERNRTLMNLKKPFVSQETIDEVDVAVFSPIVDPNDNVRTISNAMSMAINDGYKRLMFNEDVDLFFRPFFRIISKEKEYSNSVIDK